MTPTVFCVDADGNFLKTLQSRLAGAEVAVLPIDGSSLLEGTIPSPPVAMVLGPGMPANSAVGLIAKIRTCAANPLVPIAWIAADEHSSDAAAEVLIAGATDVFLVSDPANVTEFINGYVKQEIPTGLSGRVLLVDDTQVVLDYLADICTDAGLQSDTATRAEAAIESLQTDDYDLVVVDIVLEGNQSGLSVVRHLRGDGARNGAVPILVISGYTEPVRRAEALRAGADGFLVKPFIQREFIWHVSRLLQRANPLDEVDDNMPRLTDISGIDWVALGLSVREGDICNAVILGLSDKAIASRLGISFWTVRTHLQRVFHKLAVGNRRELMARYLPN